MTETSATPPDPAKPLGDPRCAVIYNPVKVSADFRSVVEEALPRHDFQPPLWLATTVDDPGRGMARQAVAEGVDLVIGAGGDGTIRAIADGLAHTGVPLGLVPSGTGNLLAPTSISRWTSSRHCTSR